ncbi:tetratricopeptide repeat protein, partial [Xylanibacter muris]
KNMYDSAYMAISDFDTTKIKDKNNKAYYNLLYTQLRFWKDADWTDSTGISKSIKHYSDTDDKEKLARAYYFYGRISGRCGNLKEAILMLKHAEHHSEETSDYLLKSRIQMTISCLNSDGGEIKSAFPYSRRAVEYAKISGDKEQLISTYNNLAFLFGRDGHTDSSLYYKKKYIPLLKYIPEEEQAIFLANLGTEYELWGTDKAMRYVLRSLKIKPLATTYRVLAAIYLEERDFTNAVKAWRQGLEICGDDMHTRINIMNDMREYKLGIGAAEEAAELADSILVLDNMLQRKWEADSVKEVQARFEADRNVEKAENGKTTAVITAVIMLMVTITIVSLYRYRKGKMKKTIYKQKELIEEQQEQLGENRKEAEAVAKKIKKLEKKETDMKTISENQKKRIKQLENENNRNIIKAEQNMADRISLGYRLYNKIKEDNGRTKEWRKTEKEAFIEYYTTINKDFTLPENYTANQSIYRILADMKFEEKEIVEKMALSSGALRTMKSRMSEQQ